MLANGKTSRFIRLTDATRQKKLADDIIECCAKHGLVWPADGPDLTEVLEANTEEDDYALPVNAGACGTNLRRGRSAGRGAPAGADGPDGEAKRCPDPACGTSQSGTARRRPAGRATWASASR